MKKKLHQTLSCNNFSSDRKSRCNFSGSISNGNLSPAQAIPDARSSLDFSSPSSSTATRSDFILGDNTIGRGAVELDKVEVLKLDAVLVGAEPMDTRETELF